MYQNTIRKQKEFFMSWHAQIAKPSQERSWGRGPGSRAQVHSDHPSGGRFPITDLTGNSDIRRKRLLKTNTQQRSYAGANRRPPSST